MDPRRLLLISLLPLLLHPRAAAAQPNGTSPPRIPCPAGMSSARCRTFAVYRTQAPDFLDVGSISDLFGVSRLSIAAANALPSEDGALLPGQPLLIPVECGCTGNQSAANVTYLIKSGDIYFLLSIATFENLTNFHAIEELNPELDPTKLQVGQEVTVPLYCKCPSRAQQDAGFPYLVTYVWEAGDDMAELSRMMNTSAEAIAAENGIPANFTSAVARPMLIPVPQPPRLPPLRYNTSGPAPPGSRAGSNKVAVTAGTVSGVLALCVVLCASVAGYRRHRKKALVHTASSSERAHLAWIKNPHGHEDTSSSPNIGSGGGGGDKLLSGVSQFIHKPVVFGAEAIVEATRDLDESYRLGGGSFFRAELDVGVFAVKPVSGDISGELVIMQMVNHANLIKLAGTAVGAGGDCVFLVYEFAEKGSLDRWLFRKPSSSPTSSSSSASPLSWTQRLHIALDVAHGLLYMHEHTQPSLVHGGIRARNILLTADFRAKISNFSAARPAVGEAAAAMSGDVFAFGRLLLELLSGRTATEAELRAVLEAGEEREAGLRRWMDPVLGGDYPMDVAISLARMARACTEEGAARRPRMAEVVFSLSVLAQSSSAAAAAADAFEKLWMPSSEESVAIANAVAGR